MKDRSSRPQAGRLRTSYCALCEASASVDFRCGRSERLFEILAFFTTLWTELGENRKLLARLYQISCLRVELAQVFARPFVVRSKSSAFL